MPLYSNNSPDSGNPHKKRKKSKLEKKVKKEGKVSLRKALKGKTKGHFGTSKKKETDYETLAQRKTLKKQQNISAKATDPKQEAAVFAAIEKMKPKEKPFMATGSSRKTKWRYNKKKKKYSVVRSN